MRRCERSAETYCCGSTARVEQCRDSYETGPACGSNRPISWDTPMAPDFAPDEDLARRLPLPLAQLYRRAHNAKTALDRHQAAFYLWEAGVKLLGSVCVVEYAKLGAHDPKLTDTLQNLSRPSLGHWWEFVRRLVPHLAS